MPASKDKHTALYYADGLRSGDIALLSRAITFVESTSPAHRTLAREIITLCGSPKQNTFRLGITGVPGAGKSTFIESFGAHVLKAGHKLAVLAVDPSSVKSGGSILGDKTRMTQLSASENVYIRPSPSGGALGGITRVTYQTISLCEAAGFDYVIVETVGVGQSEVAVGRITDFFLLLMLAGAGDDLQGIKRGIMEMADALVFTKADSGNEKRAATARSEFAKVMHLLQPPDSGWKPPVLTCSAIENKGIAEVFKVTEKYRLQTSGSGYFEQNRFRQQIQIFTEALEQEVLLKFYKTFDLKKKLRDLKYRNTAIDPFEEVASVLRETGLG